MKAVVLAGGQGMRMRPYTELIPKPMLQVAGKPILHWIVEQLSDAGLKKVILLENYLSDVVCDHFNSVSDIGIDIVHMFDKHPNHGTADLIRDAVFSDEDDSEEVIIMAGDTLIDVDYKDVVEYHRSKGGLVTVIGRSEKLSHGVFECDSADRITSVNEKPNVIIPSAAMVVSRSVIEDIDIHGDFFMNVASLIKSSGYLYKVDPNKIMHISERRDDLVSVNERWAKLKFN